jgi:serine/threonine-protein kinase RsbW
MRLSIKSVPENIEKVERYLNDIFQRFDLDTDLYPDILVSLTEAVNNAIIHGNALDTKKQVSIKTKKTKQYILFRVSDEGGGFNPSEVPDPTQTPFLLEEGGRGVLIMKALCTKVCFYNNGSTVELKFNL